MAIEDRIRAIAYEEGYFSNLPIHAPTKDSGGEIINTETFGAKGDGSTDNFSIVQRVIDIAASKSTGFRVLLPPGNVLFSQTPTLQNKVSIKGHGMERTNIVCSDTHPAFKFFGTTSNPLQDVHFSDFSIDGSQQSGTYSSSIKGIYIQYLQRCSFENIYIHDTGATGLGIDFLRDCYINHVITENCGRLGTSSSPGAAGVGIGVKSWDYGNTLANIISRGNKRAGIFFETQDGTFAQGYTLINPFAENNGEHGIGDAGCDGLQVIGGVSRNNAKSGYACYTGTIGAKPGINGRVSGLYTYGNTENGAYYDSSSSTAVGPYAFMQLHSYSNGKFGVKYDPSGFSGHDMAGLILDDSDMFSNGQAGCIVNSSAGGSGYKRLFITNNRFSNNGTNGTFQAGIYTQADITDGRIVGNTCWDDQGSPTQAYGIRLQSKTIGGNMSIRRNDLRGNGTGALLANATINSSVVMSDNLGIGPTVKSSNYTLTPADSVALVSGTTTITLPSAASNPDAKYVIKNVGSNTVTVATTSSQTIDGSTTSSLASQYASITVQSDGSNWYKV